MKCADVALRSPATLLVTRESTQVVSFFSHCNFAKSVEIVCSDSLLFLSRANFCCFGQLQEKIVATQKTAFSDPEHRIFLQAVFAVADGEEKKRGM